MTTPAVLPASDLWLRRMGRATERSAQWPQAPHTYMPYGRDIRPRSQRRTESPVSARSGNSAISERDILHAVLMVNTDGQVAMRADEDTFLNMPLSSTPHPHMYDEYSLSLIHISEPTRPEPI
eukprot:9482237-Pyramimonas_sp.AAC.1